MNNVSLYLLCFIPICNAAIAAWFATKPAHYGLVSANVFVLVCVLVWARRVRRMRIGAVMNYDTCPICKAVQWGNLSCSYCVLHWHNITWKTRLRLIWINTRRCVIVRYWKFRAWLGR